MKIQKWISLFKWRMKTGYRRSQEQATLGVMPDYGFSREGMRISSITIGKTADKHEFLAGDIVIKIGGFVIVDLVSYMSVMQKYSVCDQVDIEVLRNGSPFTISVEFI